MRTRVGLAFGLALAAAAIGAAPASAAETRADYVAQADRICKDANQESKIALRKFRPFKDRFPDPDDDGTEASKEELRKLSRKLAPIFATTNRIFGRMVGRISLLAIPSGDEQAVVTWINGMRGFKRLSDRATVALRRGQFVKFFIRILRATEPLENGMQAVRDFGFRSCPAGSLEDDVQVVTSAVRAYAHSSGS